MADKLLTAVKSKLSVKVIYKGIKETKPYLGHIMSQVCFQYS